MSLINWLAECRRKQEVTPNPLQKSFVLIDLLCRIGETALAYIGHNLPKCLRIQYFIHSVLIYWTKGISIACCHNVVFLECVSFKEAQTFLVATGVPENRNSIPLPQPLFEILFRVFGLTAAIL